MQIGKLVLDDVVHVPSFSKNLLSGIQVMKQGYKQVIENDKIYIFDQDTLVATGKYCEKTGLLKMDEQINTSNKVSKLHDINQILLKIL